METCRNRLWVARDAEDGSVIDRGSRVIERNGDDVGA